MNFIHLHNHTCYSLLDGLPQVDELINHAKEEGSGAVAITDHGVMYGVVDFYKKCKKAGVKPIIGAEAYLTPGSRFSKSSNEDKKNYHLLLLAKNNTGYSNLLQLITIAHLEGFYYKPRVDWEILQKYSEGLVAATACLGGEIPQLIIAEQMDKAKQRIKDYNDLFGQGNFYLELQHHPNFPEQEPVNNKLIELSKETGVPLVATNDMHYYSKDDAQAQDILLCLQGKKKLTDENRLRMPDDFSMRSASEMIEAFKHVPEAIKNTEKIAEMCNVELQLGTSHLPYFSVPEDHTPDSYLRDLCEKGLQERYGKDYKDCDEKIKERMDYELSVINNMGWPSYFLIVADIVDWSKKQGIVVGPGRGSAAGSLVCYLTGITNMDPLQYDLLFERFLNPDRISMPDIDLDFADTRRDEVIEYAEQKYGKDHVSQIITFGTMAARAAVRDVGRVLDFSYDYCDKLAKMIPMFAKIDDALENVGELKEIYNSDPSAKQILDYVRKLEGVARHASTHACGVLITKEPLTTYVPLQYSSSSDKSIVSQYSVYAVEDLGLLKMDFLGLKNLSIIESATNIIKKIHGKDIDYYNLPLDDQKTLELFGKGETTGVFQFESSGMKHYLRELKPSKFEDVIAMVALYRPGPMDWIPDYIAGKHGKKKITYLHPKLQPILDKTYGVAIYQEQVMQIARELAGFTMAEADVLRKAVGKKIKELLEEQKQKFIDGCVKNGINKELAQKIFAFIEPFAGYGFNRSHAACYAYIGYQTAYLKAYYPAEFMAALLTADQQNIDRVAIEIEECQNMGITVAAPDVNESFETFTVVAPTESQEKGDEEYAPTIRFGLNAVKNVGENIAEVIIKERKENGQYKDIYDFLERVTNKDLNRKSLESLIKSGCLDCFEERGKLLGNIDNLLSFNKEACRIKESKQANLFADAPEMAGPARAQLNETESIDRQQMLSWEKELLGLYISEHPFNDYKKYLQSIAVSLSDLAGMEGKKVNVAGVVSSVKKITTKNSKTMLFVKIEEVLSGAELLIFPELYEQTKDKWEEGKVVLCQGKVSDKDQEIKILTEKVHFLSLENIESEVEGFRREAGTLTHGGSSSPAGNGGGFHQENPLKIIMEKRLEEDRINELKDIFLNNPGENKVYFKVNGSGNVIESGFRVKNSRELVDKIKQKFSDGIKVVD
jgi:DNA polymerase-3 subunit alpha